MSEIEIRSLNGYNLCDETARGEIDALKQGGSTGIGRSGEGYGSEIFNSYGEDGPSNQAEGQYSHAENFATRALGLASHAEGYDTAALGQSSHVEGERSEAHGTAAHAEGITTKAYGLGSHSEGVGGSYVQHFRVNSVDTDTTYTKFNIVRSTEMPPLGAYIASPQNPKIITKVIEVDSVNQNFVVSTPLFNRPVMELELATLAGVAGGDYSHIEGNNNVAFGASSHAEGIYTIAVDDGSHVQGKYNIAESNYVHIIGNGTSIDSKSNAHTLDWQGNAWYSGDVYVGSTSGTNKDEGSKKLATEEYVAEEIANIGNTLALHPIGSIYMSVNETSPAELFGGTWEQLKNRFLLGTSDAHPLGEEGGSETHTLTEGELPKISGTISLGAGAAGETGGGYGAVRTASGVFQRSVQMQYGRPTIETSSSYGVGNYRDAQMNFGSGQAHNNMPPYIAVNIWKRVA